MGIGVYVHIPFCIKKCRYCDFNSSDSKAHLEEAYTRALIDEIDRCPYEEAVDTVFIGGGTPTAIQHSRLLRIIEALSRKFRLQSPEFTVEVNPATADFETFCSLHEAGVNRISIGLQSAHADELARLGRIHTFEAFLKTYAAAVKSGISNINVDLMFALPGQGLDSWRDTLQKAAAVGPQHLSCYSLIVEPDTPLAAERPVLPDDDTYCEMYDYTIGFLASMGYEQYEISNFAQAGYRCRHNMKYWTRAPYIGFGCGASSLYNNRRWDNTRSMEAYIRKNEPVVTAVPEEEQMREFIILGLRLTEGFSLEEFRQNFGVGFESRYGQTVRRFVSGGLMELGRRCRLTREGLKVSNAIMCEFM